MIVYKEHLSDNTGWLVHFNWSIEDVNHHIVASSLLFAVMRQWVTMSAKINNLTSFEVQSVNRFLNSAESHSQLCETFIHWAFHNKYRKSIMMLLWVYGRLKFSLMKGFSNIHSKEDVAENHCFVFSDISLEFPELSKTTLFRTVTNTQAIENCVYCGCQKFWQVLRKARHWYLHIFLNYFYKNAFFHISSLILFTWI